VKVRSHCGVVFAGGLGAREGETFKVGETLARGDPVGDGDPSGVADGVAVGPGLLTGTVADATICHCPFRRTNVSIERNS
jgi:hypothetical protein